MNNGFVANFKIKFFFYILDFVDHIKMGEKDQDIKSPMKRVGSTRKIVMFSSK